ncbi:uncharacterized protein G2W53_012498 [Senna tora]|uniref:Uncharacterized protein n=1 Tax=Senna tora TaxID=362788 RepID=A0A834WNL9_9FABA|nr:uncharacterized protein G2W53_012498 [Senna tora]
MGYEKTGDSYIEIGKRKKVWDRYPRI